MLNVQVNVSNNKMLNEKIAVARLVNTQSMSFEKFCDYVSEGSTITAADVLAVMKRLETCLPLLLSLNTKVTVSPSGLIFRPVVKGSLTQGQLRAKLEAKKAELIKAGEMEAADEIEIDREIKASDLGTNDMTAHIEVTLPGKWTVNFQQVAEFKRVTKSSVPVPESDGNDGDDDNDNDTPAGGGTPKYTLTVKANNDAYGTVEGGGEYAENASATLKAIAKNGYEFKQWNDGNTAATRVVTVVADKTYTATFSQKQSEEEGTI